MSIIGESEFSQGDYTENNIENLLELSADLKSIFEQGLLSDIVLIVNGKDIRCHKAILSIRSKWFSLKIRQTSSSGSTVIEVNEKNQILNAVLTYIYTGNLKLLESLNIPLIDLRNATEKYGLSGLKNIVTNIIKSESIFDKTRSTEFLWIVKFDCNTSFTHVCPSLKDFSLHGSDKWGLEVQPFFFINGTCTIGIYLTRETANEAQKIIHVINISIQLVNSSGSRQLLFNGELTVTEDGKNKLAQFTQKSEQGENLVFPSTGTLTLVCELTVCGKLGDMEYFQLKGLYRRYFSNELLVLSQDMQQMLKMGQYSDTSVKLKGCSLFQLHSYIIFGRSRMPVPLLSRMADVTGFGSISWKSFIYFMYTGQTRFLDDHARDVYYAFRKLNLVEPTQKYENILAKNMNIHNAFRILRDSVEKVDTYLMSIAAHFLACNSSVSSEPQTWISLASDNSMTAIFQNQLY